MSAGTRPMSVPPPNPGAIDGRSHRRKNGELIKRWPRGCAAPVGYCDWHEWAEAQGKQGLKQTQCKRCGRWRFPQEKNALGSCADQIDCGRYLEKFGPRAA